MNTKMFANLPGMLGLKARFTLPPSRLRKSELVPYLKGVTILLAALAAAQATGDKRPHFVVEPPSRVLWPATRGAHAVCRAAGHPPPDVHWVTAEGQLLTTIPGLRHVLTDGRLVLGARRSLLDAGGGGGAVLRCRAANRAGAVLSRPVLLQPERD
ncbi:hypothetical protein MSG28_004045 [Choristoneura fumiferana]|uniref:Uncharacterized protein n=1 Tax=Choristoneura fumiferana TaxID=7141 RepID=A0ACC0KH61_CHOFU|nr:hypothetical protein MSG28_004045 [Choristoneura fumiferana]